MNENGVVDVTILGAGPTGLAAAYYIGHRDGTVRIVESLEILAGILHPERFGDHFPAGAVEQVRDETP